MLTRKLFKYPILLIFAAFIATSIVVSCGNNREIDSQLAKAESLMVQYPDSAITILAQMDTTAMSEYS